MFQYTNTLLIWTRIRLSVQGYRWSHAIIRINSSATRNIEAIRPAWKGIDFFFPPGAMTLVGLFWFRAIVFSYLPPFRGCRASERCSDIPITRRVENFRLRLITERFPDDDLTWGRNEPRRTALFSLSAFIRDKRLSLASKNLAIFIKFALYEISKILSLYSVKFYHRTV